MTAPSQNALSEALANFKLPKKALEKVARLIQKAVVREAKKEFVKMGLSTRDLEKKFEVRVESNGTINVESTLFIDMDGEGRKKEPMKWLSQERKKKAVNSFDLTPAEKKLKITKGDRENRSLLIVPMKDKKSGRVIFRTAPLRTQNAWVHPGIARGAFLQKALDKALEEVGPLIMEALSSELSERRV